MLEYVVDVVGSPYSESYVDWMLHCWSMSSVWSVVLTACRMWTGCCIAGAYRRCGWYSVQRVVRGLGAAMLEHVVDVVDSPYSDSYVDWMLYCWSMSSMWSVVRTVSRTWIGCCNAGACRCQSWCWQLGRVESCEWGD